MLAALVKRIVLVSVFLLLAESLLPDTGTGRFARGVLELTGLTLLILPLKDLQV